MRTKKLARREQHGNRRLRGLIRDILRSAESPELLELYYWSREETLLPIIRAVIAMPESSRLALAGFLKLSQSTQTTASLDNAGRLILEAADVSQALQQLAELKAEVERKDAIVH